MSHERRDERIDRIVSETVRAEYGEAEAPREAMWAAIEADRRGAPPAPTPRLRWAAALAAAAVVAAVVFGIYRYQEPGPVNGPSVPTVEAVPVDPHDLILRGHLARTGALLDTVAAGDAATPEDARALLARTRALLADPAIEPAAGRLLADAEIALALLVRSRGLEGSVEQVALVETVADGRLATRLLAASGSAP